MIMEWLESIFSFFKSIYDFVVSFFEDIVYIIQLTAAFVARIPSYFSWLPAEALTLIVALFAVVVIYKVLGREG